jgi:hypothetical protein
MGLAPSGNDENPGKISGREGACPNFFTASMRPDHETSWTGWSSRIALTASNADRARIPSGFVSTGSEPRASGCSAKCIPAVSPEMSAAPVHALVRHSDGSSLCNE